ncbi:MAG: hypothetical protein QOJ51_2596, partial [Acidobacteriaceae bacterium]|nr:hypothetical protein [Acidobacteriaceae bacterium]
RDSSDSHGQPLLERGFEDRVVESHISRKTSEMWGTQDL